MIGHNERVADTRMDSRNLPFSYPPLDLYAGKIWRGTLRQRGYEQGKVSSLTWVFLLGGIKDRYQPIDSMTAVQSMVMIELACRQALKILIVTESEAAANMYWILQLFAICLAFLQTEAHVPLQLSANCSIVQSIYPQRSPM